jgi:mono/diheme cytochrome c family protein
MSKRPIIVFVVFFAAVALAVPLWAISKEGAGGASPERVAAGDESAKQLFQQNCGACHTLARAGTDGVVGPDLDALLGPGTPEANEPLVAAAIDDGVQGRMPAALLKGDDVTEVAEFVARVAGQ